MNQKTRVSPRMCGDVAVGLGSAALAITPFLARFFELLNKALLAAGMGLEEYSYILRRRLP